MLDLRKYLSKGATVTAEAEGTSVKGVVAASSVVEFERTYLVKFEDGSSKWLTQEFIRALTKN